MALRSRTLETPAGQGEALVEQIRALARPFREAADLDALLDHIGEARVVLLGEASHGTSEYYLWRQEITRRLILEKRFTLVGVEGDWPDCYRVNRYLKGYPDAGRNARDVLHAFDRWPTWMWANEEVAGFAEWLRRHNAEHGRDQVGFYGLDVYSLWESMHAVTQYLQKNDGEAAAAARRAFECFEPYEDDVQRYARATLWMNESCEEEVLGMLSAVRRHVEEFPHDGEAAFNAEQNALVAANAEEYYRTMTRGDAESWNVRDHHMIETLDRLLHYHGRDAKAIVWAHNTHIGDARATDMRDAGMVNIGQLARERFGAEQVSAIGFASHRGTVIAGREWEAPMEVVSVPPAAAGSWEDVLHRAAPRDQLLLLENKQGLSELYQPRGQRAIGVVYRPQFERYGNYVPTVLPGRYDALVYLDETHALRPLHMPVRFDHEVPETYPSAV